MGYIPPAARLRQWIARSGYQQQQVAPMLRCSAPHLSRVLTGGRIPSLALAVRIQNLACIPAADWYRDVPQVEKMAVGQ